MTALENRMILLETSNIMKHGKEETNNIILYEEYDLPLQNMQALEQLEQLLKDSSFADKMVLNMWFYIHITFILYYSICIICTHTYIKICVYTCIINTYKILFI